MKLLDSLTPAQREATQHLEGPLLILAGPGSGKTRVVTHRIAYLLHQGIPAGNVLALTFTNKAADEMRQRLEWLAPNEPVWVSTFHRFCAHLLRGYAPLVGLEENFTIYDAKDSRRVLRQAIEDVRLDLVSYTPEKVASAIRWAKNNLISANDYDGTRGGPISRVVMAIYPQYQARLLASSAVDFDDLLLYTEKLLRENPELRAVLDERHRYILVDEYQDTNLVQYGILRGLSVDHPNLAVTGDPDQSIYGWRGANLNNILQFEQHFRPVHTVRLEQNYRSTKQILCVADRLIAHNTQRKKKCLYTDNEEGIPVRLATYATQHDEATGISGIIAEQLRLKKWRPKDVAIFYRVNALSRSLEFAFHEQGIPYQLIRGLEFYQRKEIKNVLSYAQLVNNPRDDIAFLRVVNSPLRGIGAKTIAYLNEHATRSSLSMLAAAREHGTIESIHKRAEAKLAKFLAVIDRITEVAGSAVEEILGTILTETGVADALKSSGTEDDLNRLANLEELLTAARQFDEQFATVSQQVTSEQVQTLGRSPLDVFLEQACLVNDTDDWEEQSDKVTLMSLHAAKGLEFPVVFLVAVEEGLLPHERCRHAPGSLEEERRLLFVGITRAAKYLQLSHTLYREFRGQRRMTVPSQFLMELPRQKMELVGPSWLEQEADMKQPDTVVEPPLAFPVKPIGVTTAAELVGSPPSPVVSVSPDVFAHGMTVTHPDYGLGKILAISGGGAHRKATVAFVTAGQRKFVLASSPLRPAKGSYYG